MTNNPPANKERKYESPILIALSEVQEEETSWLWENRIPIGAITLLIGDPGLGKSLVSLDIASRLTRGGVWPDNNTPISQGGVLLLTPEDDLPRTIVKRLNATGADMTRITYLKGIKVNGQGEEHQRSLDFKHDVSIIEQAIGELPYCRLLVIDPLSQFLGNTDSHKNADVRATLAPLVEMAQRLEVAIIGINHLTKGEGPAIHRSLGSVGFMALARSAWAVSADPEDDRRRFFVGIKNNLAPPTSNLAFRIENINHIPVLKWDADPVQISAEEALNQYYFKKVNTARDEAKSWLREMLAAEPMAAPDILEAARENGISEKTLRRAFKALGGKPRKDGMDGGWVWSLDSEDGHS